MTRIMRIDFILFKFLLYFYFFIAITHSLFF